MSSFFFFFSSRRRHTRFDCDWSSDVCSSDLYSAMSGSPGAAHSLARLRALVRTYPSVLVGYSGGVDSALLAVVLRQELGRERMLAAGGRGPSYPTGPGGLARAVAPRLVHPCV